MLETIPVTAATDTATVRANPSSSRRWKLMVSPEPARPSPGSIGHRDRGSIRERWRAAQPRNDYGAREGPGALRVAIFPLHRGLRLSPQESWATAARERSPVR